VHRVQRGSEVYAMKIVPKIVEYELITMTQNGLYIIGALFQYFPYIIVSYNLYLFLSFLCSFSFIYNSFIKSFIINDLL